MSLLRYARGGSMTQLEVMKKMRTLGCGAVLLVACGGAAQAYPTISAYGKTTNTAQVGSGTAISLDLPTFGRSTDNMSTINTALNSGSFFTGTQGGALFATVTDPAGSYSSIDAITGSIAFINTGTAPGSSVTLYAILTNASGAVVQSSSFTTTATSRTLFYNFALPAAGTYTLGFAAIEAGSGAIANQGLVSFTANAVGAPEVDPTSAALPLALSVGLLLLANDRRRKALAC